MLIVDFHHFFVDDGHVTYIQRVRIQETVEGLVVTKFFDVGLVETFPELAPHGIEHHFGQCSETCIVLNLVVLRLDTLVLIVLADVLLAFGFIVAYPFGPSTGFLFDF